MKRSLRLSLFAAAAIVGLVSLAACGDDSANSASSPSASVMSSATNAASTPAAASSPDSSAPDSSAPESPAASGSAASGSAAPEGCPPEGGTDAPVTSFSAPPPMCIDPAKKYQAVVTTNLGEYTIDLDTAAAPKAVNNFVVLARSHFYDNTTCHRIIPQFMAQCGDPTGTGSGGPGYQFEDELPVSPDAYTFGAVAMANSGPNTQGSQFFTVTAPNGYPLDPNYTVFGKVSAGQDTLAAIDAVGNPNNNGIPPLKPVNIEKITINES